MHGSKVQLEEANFITKYSMFPAARTVDSR